MVACSRDALAVMLFISSMFGSFLGSIAVVVHRWLNPPQRASNEGLRAELERAAAACTDDLTARHLRAIVSALLR
jgi:hypothetical protein